MAPLITNRRLYIAAACKKHKGGSAPHVASAITLTSTGTGTTASAITALATATTFWFKARVQVNTLRAMGNGTQWEILLIDNNGASGVFQAYVTNTAASGPYQLTVTAIGLGGLNSATVTQAALPANGQDVIIAGGYANGSQQAYLFDGLGNALISSTGSAFDGAITAGSGFVHVNGGAVGTGSTLACTYDGLAIYTNTMPSQGSALWYQKPLASDTGIAYLCYMNDASSGTSPGTSAAQVGTTGLTWTTGQFSYTTDTTSGAWG